MEGKERHIRTLLSKAEGERNDYLICATDELRALMNGLDSTRTALRDIAQMWPPDCSGKEMQERALQEISEPRKADLPVPATAEAIASTLKQDDALLAKVLGVVVPGFADAIHDALLDARTHMPESLPSSGNGSPVDEYLTRAVLRVFRKEA